MAWDFGVLKELLRIDRTPMMNWVSESGEELPEDESEEPEQAQLDELPSLHWKKN